jgi:oligoendopeptidase F
MNSKAVKRVISVVVMGVFIFCQTAGFAEAAVLKRSEVPDKYKWNLADLYKDSQAFEADFSRVQNEYIPKIKEFQGKLTNADTLLKCLQLSDELWIIMDRLYAYACLKADENLQDNAASEQSH